jgi:ABC-type dipeptide/oligopeptide/nickel transport system ATPase component
MILVPVTYKGGVYRNEEIMDLIEDLKRDFDTAIVYITHDLGVVAEMCDSVVVMYLGRVVEEGPVGRHLPQRQAPVHAGAALCNPRASSGERKKGKGARRRSAVRHQHSLRLQVPPSLPAEDGQMRTRSAGNG